MEPSIEELKENYKRFSDAQLMKLAMQDASELRPEAVKVMQDEINSRGLSKGLLDGIKVQLKELSEKEILEYCELIRKQDCPLCGENLQKLNATIKGEVVSFIVMTNYHKELIIACPSCLAKANRNAIIKTALLGWWGVPWGIVRTIQALNFNYKLLSQTKSLESNQSLREFVIKNVGTIETNKNDPERMRSFVKYLK